jgi:hypothetical protein
MYTMTKAKYQYPRSRVRSRTDSESMVTTIPEKIVHAMRLQAGDSIEWIWITEGFESYVKARKVSPKD